MSSPTAQRPKRPRASPRSSPTRIVHTPLLRVFVPGNAPSANKMYVKRKRATEYTDALGRKQKSDRALTRAAYQWRDDVANTLMRWRFPESAPRPNLAVSFTWVGMLSDIDNPIKITLDGVKLGLAVDDAYVSELAVSKRKISPGAERGAWIEVRTIPYG